MRAPGHQPKTVAVVGAGPAGMAAAIAAARAGARVVLLERQARAGRKLAASGGGRCNLANVLGPDAFIARMGPQGRFAGPALKAWGRDDLLDAMRRWGVPCAAPDGFHYFPVSQRAQDVVAALEREMRRAGATVRLGVEASGLDLSGGRLVAVRAADGGRLPAHAAILATGGITYPGLGGCGLGYALARQAGHKIVEPAPALAGLVTRESWPAACAGVTLPDAEARIDLGRFRGRPVRGELLFTHHGVSGPVALDLSGTVSRLLLSAPSVPLHLTLLPETGTDAWAERMVAWRRDRGRKTVRNLLDEHLPHSLAAAAADACGIAPGLPAAQLTGDARARLLAWLGGVTVTVTGTEGAGRAMVTSGGVALSEVYPSTLESRLAKGLFFAGETLDLDGPCGGFNIQWAMSSGWLAGLSAGRSR